MSDSRHKSAGFPELQRALLRRRWSEIDVRLRIELLALATLINAFLFWQMRVPLDSLARGRGMPAVALALSVPLGCLILLRAVVVGSHLAFLIRNPPGPYWRALPITPSLLVQHLAWESRWRGAWVALLGPGIISAAFGLLPLWVLGSVVAALLPLWWAAAKLGSVVASWLTIRARPAGTIAWQRGFPATQFPDRPGLVRVRWRREPQWLALWRKDLWLARRSAPVRRRLFLPILLAALSVIAWGLPVTAPLARLVAFGLALLAAAAFAEWLIELSAADPFPILRGLPVGVMAIWTARTTWVIAAVSALLIAHGFAAQPLDREARHLFLIWIGGATFAIGLLAVHYGITLFPRAAIAQRLLGLTLGLAIAASLMIPLMGWITLLTAVIHSALRLPRWARLEDPS